MQELTNDNYSYTKLYSIFHIEYKATECITNKKEETIHDPPLAGAASLSFQYGEFVNKANKGIFFYYSCIMLTCSSYFVGY